MTRSHTLAYGIDQQHSRGQKISMNNFKSDIDLRPICGKKKRLGKASSFRRLNATWPTPAWTPKKTLSPGLEIQSMEISETLWCRPTTETLTLGKLVEECPILIYWVFKRKTLYLGDQRRHFLLISRLRFFQSKPRCTLDKLCNAPSSPKCPTDLDG